MSQHDRERDTLANIFMFVVVIFLVTLLFRVVFTDTDIPVSSSDAEATAVANERLFQMAQWAVGSVLTIGIALIGFNWVQSRRDRDEVLQSLGHVNTAADELTEQQTAFETNITNRIAQVERAVLFSWDANLGERLLQEAKQEMHPLDPSPSYFIRKFQAAANSYARRRAYGQLVLQRADVERSTGTLSEKEVDQLRAFLPELLNFDTQLGGYLAQFLLGASEQEKQGQV